MIDSYLTIKKHSAAEIKITRSKFIAQTFPLNPQSEISDLIKKAKKKYYDASHHPYAFRTGIDKNNFKISDDGEPQGTAGRPILDAIDKHDLTDVLVIVSRYFGGTRLGTGGLRRAFFDAADLSLNKAKIIEKYLTERLMLEFDYKFMNVVMKIIESEKIKLDENISGENAKLILEVRLSKIEKVKKELSGITNGSIRIKIPVIS